MIAGTALVARGSLLIEAAVVLMLAGLLAAGSFALMADAEQVYRQRAAHAALTQVEAAIKAFVLREKRLPCPDPVGNGLEGGGSACAATLTVGFVPFAALGLDEVRIDGHRRVRYGVWRGGGSDLVNPSSPTISRLDDLDGSRTFVQAASLALAAGLDASKPYIPGFIASTRQPDCSVVLANPAFVLAPEPAATAGPAACFASDPDGHADAMGIDRQELLGWWLQSSGGNRGL